MTASSSVRTATAVADPSNPTNCIIPFATQVQVVTASTSTTYSPPLIALIAGTNGNARLVLSGNTTPMVVALTKGIPLTGMKIAQVRTTNTTVQTFYGLT